jgi:hypothetical protein
MAKFAQNGFPVQRPFRGARRAFASNPENEKGRPSRDALSKSGADLVTSGLLEKA